MSTHPANWYPDPAGRFELRYWDGATWTDHFVAKPAPSGSDAPTGSTGSARIVEFDVDKLSSISIA